MTEDVIEWLAQEVRDLLDVSSVGLYEFIWLLRSGQPGIKDDERQAIAVATLRRLFSEESLKLVLLTWPDHVPAGEVDLDAVSPSDWDDPPEDRPYLALVRGQRPMPHGREAS